MNTIEHNQYDKENLTGFWFGQVIKSDDPDNLHRVKVRVRGLFNEPVLKEDIPWALPISKSSLPELGDEVCVVFMDEDIKRPFYFPKTMLDKAKVQLLEELYSKIVGDRKDRAVSGVSAAGGSFSEPKTEAPSSFSPDVDVQLYPEKVAKENGELVDEGSPEKGHLFEVGRGEGKEYTALTHPSGSFVEIHKDGSVVVHSVKDIYTIAEGKLGGLVKGDLILKVEGDIRVEASDFKIKATKLTIEGGQLQVSGTAAPGQGPFCAIPNCVFSGAPHGGNLVSGT